MADKRSVIDGSITFGAAFELQVESFSLGRTLETASVVAIFVRLTFDHNGVTAVVDPSRELGFVDR